jgi:FkbM family methyltransferase
MSFISYAQNYEDVMLWRALKHVKSGFYIDVGAAWPDEHSVTKAFYDRGWRGINIEPNPVHHASLVKQRTRDINLQLAIGECAGQLTMNLVGDTGLSTLDKGIADQHKDGGWGVVEQTVSVDTLASVCAQHLPAGQEVHFLKVDAEGFEEQALRSYNWKEFRPWIVLVEATLPMTQQESYESWEPILLGADYLFAYADGLNRYYISKEHADLAPEFKYPPNFFDGFSLIDNQKSEAKAQQAEAKAQQAEAKAQQAEAKAQQAEAKGWQLNNELRQVKQELHDVHQSNHNHWLLAEERLQQLKVMEGSRSWQFTRPLRWSLHQWCLLCEYGGKARLKALTQKILRKGIAFVAGHPRLKSLAIWVAHRTGIAIRLKQLVRRVPQSTTETPHLLIHQGAEREYVSLHLDKRAARVLADLKNAINGTYRQ